MGNLCIIPARGGSKRIPRKNIKDFLGKPIIAYSIEAALESGLFEEVMVSTDDREIANIALKFGAVVPFLRSKQNADDFATTSDVLHEVINSFDQLGRVFENMCCIYPTAPLIEAKDIRNGYDILIKGGVKVVFPIVEYSYPIWRAIKENNDSNFEMVWPENINKRSQDLKKTFHDAGQWYWINIERFGNDPVLMGESFSCLTLNEIKVQDIDNETDWKLAELKYEYLQGIKKAGI